MKNVCFFLFLTFSSLSFPSLTFAQSSPIKLINSTPSQDVRPQLENLQEQIFSYLDSQAEKPVSFRSASTSHRIVPGQSFTNLHLKPYTIPVYSQTDQITDFEYLEYDNFIQHYDVYNHNRHYTEGEREYAFESLIELFRFENYKN